MKHTFAKRLAALVVGTLTTVVASCHARLPTPESPTQATSAADRIGDGRSMFSFRWLLSTADRRAEYSPQETASVAVSGSYVYVGSAIGGELLAIVANSGRVLYRVPTGATSTAPLAHYDRIYLGTASGAMYCIEAMTGKVTWKFQSNGPISQPPIVVGKHIVFANETDRITALDARTGDFAWQYKNDSGSNESLLRGHAGLAYDGQNLYTGFSDATLVSLRPDNGSVVWSSRLVESGVPYADIDSTPIIVGDMIYAASGAGGVFALSRETGLVQWNRKLGPRDSIGLEGVAADDKALYVTAADDGVFALDFRGNILWQYAMPNGGEPSSPILSQDSVLVSFANAGLMGFDKNTGLLQTQFDPGGGITAPPVVASSTEIYVMSNQGNLIALGFND